MNSRGELELHDAKCCSATLSVSMPLAWGETSALSGIGILVVFRTLANCVDCKETTTEDTKAALEQDAGEEVCLLATTS